MDIRHKNIELRFLTALATVEQEGSFSRAAERLHYTQSAISQQVRQLEHIVGQQLIERPGGPRPVSLTSAGRILLKHTEGIMARLDSALADLQALSSGEAGELHIGYYQSLGTEFLPRALQHFGTFWPNIKLKLTEAEDDLELLQQVESGQIDLTFMVYPMVSGPFAHSELFDDPYVVVVPEGGFFDQYSNTSIHPRELSGLPIITYSQMRSVHAIEHRLGLPELSEQIILRSNNNSTILGLVRAGVGIALISEMSVGPFQSGLRVLPLARVSPRTIGIAWHRERHTSPPLDSFIRIIQKQADTHS